MLTPVVTLLSVMDFFVHYIVAEGFDAIAKNVIFTIDTSGSMRGQRMGMAKDALLTILRNVSFEGIAYIFRSCLRLVSTLYMAHTV